LIVFGGLIQPIREPHGIVELAYFDLFVGLWVCCHDGKLLWLCEQIDHGVGNRPKFQPLKKEEFKASI
jgi:hypothetical protein